MSENEVVISGIGGLLPQSPNLQDFGRNLLANKILPVECDRWKQDEKLGIPAVSGQVPQEYFDDVFFGVNKKLAKSTDPTAKLGYERSFEAIIDAGVHPSSLQGSNVCVITAAGVNEFEQKIICIKPGKTVGYNVMGLSRTMSANRISYFFDFKGPSYCVDASWAAVHQSLQRASEALRSGETDGVIIVASSVSRFPNTSYLLKMLGLISDDTLTRSFDENGSGSVRSEGAIAFFLQRGDVAKRCYAKVLAAGAEYVGHATAIDITLPNPLGMQSFLTNLYRDHAIDPKRIAYLEADGAGHPIRDECELNAIDAALVKGAGREVILPIGSVKPNLGHVDCVNGFAAVCKTIVAMETGIIPATLNYKTANRGVKGPVDGRIKVTDSNTPLELGKHSVVAVNSMGLAGGMVGHTVLQPNEIQQQHPQDPAHHLPRLVTVSGRSEDAVRDILTKIQSTPFDTNFYRLVQDSFSKNIRGYDYRGYVICPLGDTKETLPVEQVQKRTLWFVYSGMGSQWPGMGAGLMEIPIFSETIERLHAILLPKGFNLKEILTETGSGAFDNIIKSFLGITACQIALTNVLTAIGLVPDGIIGHSLGELGCAYVDGCLTEEQTILATWARGVASMKAVLIKGKMAAIGLSAKDVQSRLPPSIDIACKNSDTSCTLSGPAEDVETFVKELSDEGVFARSVNVSDIAYHSRYIQPAAPFLRKHLSEIIPNPRRRSAKWVTTSVPQHLRDTEEAKYCSFEYQTNNLLSPVLFEEGLAHIPKQCILIEVAPHGLLQAILKRAMPDPRHIPLTQRGHSNPIHFLLSAIGKTSLAGAEPKVSALYPDVAFPVPRGTPSLAQLVTWLHDDTTRNDLMDELKGDNTVEEELDMDKPGVKLHQTPLYPLSEIMLLAWKSLSIVLQDPIESFSVRFNNFRIISWANIPSDAVETVQAECMSGLSDVAVHLLSRDDSRPTEMARGGVLKLEKGWNARPLPPVSAHDIVTLTKVDVYRDFTARGITYSPKYQVINYIKMGEQDWLVSVTHDGSWAPFLEAIVQVYLMKHMEETCDICLPRTIQRLDIDPSRLAMNSEVMLRLNVATGILEGDGVYVANFEVSEATLAVPQLQRVSTPRSDLIFVPFGETSFQTIDEFLRLAVQYILESGKKTKEAVDVTLLKIPNGTKTSVLCETLGRALRKATGVKVNVETLSADGAQPPGLQGSLPLLVTAAETLAEAGRALPLGSAGMILVWSRDRLMTSSDSKMAVLAEQKFGGDWLSLLRRSAPLSEEADVVLDVPPGSRAPLSVPADKVVVLVWRGLPQEAVAGAVADVDSRPYADRARMVFIGDAPALCLREPLFAEQLARGARVNVLLGGRWGCWRPLPRTLSAALFPKSLEGVRLRFLGLNPLHSAPCRPGSLAGHVDYVGCSLDGQRVMGIGQWLADDQRPRLDPELRWAVPSGWTDQDAVTVPYLYAVVYHSLLLKAEAKRGESILVHRGGSALGQAAIRVASHLGCSPIFTTVASHKERQLLLSIFPQLEPRHVLTCAGSGSFEYRIRILTGGQGVRLVVNTLSGRGLQASMHCLSNWGRLLHHKREDMLAGCTIGTQDFLKSLSLYGFSGDELFRASARERAAVVRAVREGLEQGAVQPIVGAKLHNLLDGFPDDSDCTKAVVEVENTTLTSKQTCDPNKTYIIAGGDAADALLLAARLALLGARHILAAVQQDSAASSARQRSLRRQHGAQLQVREVRSWDAAAARLVVQAATSMAPVHKAIVIGKEEPLGALLVGALPRGATLVQVPERVQTATLLDLLSAPASSPLHPDTPTGGVEAEAALPAALPSSCAALSELGALAALQEGPEGPPAVRLQELPSLGLHLRHVRENAAVFVMPPLGVLEPGSREQLAALARRLYSPVILVETPGLLAGSSVSSVAAAVAEAVLRCQPHGPYNLLGWRLSTVLALEVQRRLEAANKKTVTFLVHGDVELVQRWAAAQETSGHAELQESPLVRIGEEAVARVLGALASHSSDVTSPFAGRVHAIRGAVDDQQSLNVKDPHVILKTVAEPAEVGLDSAVLAEYINRSAAYSQLASNSDLRISIDVSRQCPRAADLQR